MTDPPRPNLPLIAELGAQRHAKQIALARKDPAYFCEYVLRDEETGGRIQLQPFQREMIRQLLEHNRLVITAFPESGKTNIVVGLCLWLLGHNKRLRICFFSQKCNIAEKPAALMASYIEGQTEGGKALREVFPDLKPGGEWSKQDGYTVVREGNIKDPSIRAIGLDGGITSARIDVLVPDDILTETTTATPYLREKVYRLMQGTFKSRVTRTGRIWLLCNAWWEDDAAGRLSQTAGWHSHTIKVLDEAGKPAWEDRWPKARIDDYLASSPVEGPRELYCERRRMGEANRFRDEHIEVALRRGIGLDFVPRVERFQEGEFCFEGVDMAFSKTSKRSDRNALAALLRRKDRARQLIMVETDSPATRWTSHEFLDHLEDHRSRYWCTHIVESVSAQEWIAEQAAGRDLDVQPFFTTGRNKYSPEMGVEALANDCALGMLIIPCRLELPGEQIRVNGTLYYVHKHVAELISEMRAYAPDPNVHTGDILMALWMANTGAKGHSFQHRVGTAGDAFAPEEGVDPDSNDGGIWDEFGHLFEGEIW